MHEVDLYLNTEGKNMHTKCILTHYDNHIIHLKSTDKSKRLPIYLKNTTILKTANNTCEIKSLDTSITYTLKFINIEIIDTILQIIQLKQPDKLNNFEYIKSQYLDTENVDAVKEMNEYLISSGVIKDKIVSKDDKYLDVLLRYGNYMVIAEILKNINIIYDKSVIEHEQYLTFNHEYLVDLPSDRKDLILSIIQHKIEKDYEMYKPDDIIQKINTYTGIIKYLNHVKKTRKQLTLEIIEHFLSNNDISEFSTILIHLAEYCIKEVRMYMTCNTKSTFNMFLEALDNFKSERSDSVQNFYFAFTFIFDNECENELLGLFYQNVYLLVLNDCRKVYEPRRCVEEFRILHYRVLDLLVFMGAQHDYMFPEFFITSGLLQYFMQFKDTNEEFEFFWNQMIKCINHSDSILKDYI